MVPDPVAQLNSDVPLDALFFFPLSFFDARKVNAPLTLRALCALSPREISNEWVQMIMPARRYTGTIK